MVTPSMTDQVGRVLGGRYRLVAPLGAGGSGRVFLADDVTLRRRVAVKVLHDALAGDEAFLRRFRAEAQAAAALNHANIMAVYDWGDDGGPFLVLEHLSGGSVRALLDAGHRLSLSQAVLVGLHVARGLDHAHRRGLVHRDIKPANLLFDDEANLRIADFGVARALAEAAWTEPSGVMVGSARYAAPEQAEGGAIDGRADVYALGLVLIECVTGEVPFAADTTMSTLMARVNAPVTVPDEMGPLVPILSQMGQPQPSDRPDAAEVGRALFDVAADLPAPAALPIGASQGSRAGGSPDSDDLTIHAEEAAAPIAAGRPAAIITDDPVRDRRRRRWPLLAVAAVLALIGIGFGVTQLAAETVEVPVVVGSSEAEAIAALGDDGLGLDVTIDRQFADGTQPGVVLSTSPAAGSEVRVGGNITLVVSRGPTPVAVPDLSGMTLDEAENALTEAGLIVGEVARRHHEEIDLDRVITYKHEGEDRIAQAPRGAAVDVVLSDGPAPRTVPDTSGLDPEAAEAALEAEGFKVDVVEVFSDTVAAGAVVGTNPPAGSEVDRGAKVELRVSKGPDLVTVPDVEGESLNKAISELEKAGLEVVGVIGNPRDKVLTTDPTEGERVRRGTEVTIIMRGARSDDD